MIIYSSAFGVFLSMTSHDIPCECPSWRYLKWQSLNPKRYAWHGSVENRQLEAMTTRTEVVEEELSLVKALQSRFASPGWLMLIILDVTQLYFPTWLARKVEVALCSGHQCKGWGKDHQRSLSKMQHDDHDGASLCDMFWPHRSAWRTIAGLDHVWH